MNAAPKNALSPLKIGWMAAKANFIPGLVIQGLMVAVLLAYYLYEPAGAALSRVADLKREHGYLFSFLLGAIAGGVLSEGLNVAVFQRGRVTRENGKSLLFFIFFWGGQAVVVDAFYQLQASIFGSQADLATVVKKVAVDQWLFTPLFAIPVGLTGLAWKEGGYRLAPLRGLFTRSFLREKAIPSLFANWAVWIPVVSVVYSLPSALQIPFYGLALTFWVMIFTWISRQKR